MTLVIATMALLVGLALPAVRTLRNSFQTQSGVKSMVEAALSSARAMAMSSQNYVGVRFQKLCVTDNAADPFKNFLNAPQYMIFIMHEEPKKMGGLANGFRAVEGLEPIRLPETMGVIDLNLVNSDATIAYWSELSDATTFSIVFAPSGKVVGASGARAQQGRRVSAAGTIPAPCKSPPMTSSTRSTTSACTSRACSSRTTIPAATGRACWSSDWMRRTAGRAS